jgi:hypothetical protein
MPLTLSNAVAAAPQSCDSHDRWSRAIRAIPAKTAPPTEVLQLGALERFVSDFKARVLEIMGTRKKEADDKVAQAKKDVAAADDEHAEKVAARKLQDALDERTRLASAVEREAALSYKRGEYSDALTPVVNAMLGR